MLNKIASSVNKFITNNLFKTNSLNNQQKRQKQKIMTNEYKYFPKDASDLSIIIYNQIHKYGNNVDLNDIDVSQITNMNNLFYNSKFNGDISKWDVSNVTDMFSIFTNSKFNGDISNWNVSNVKVMSSMFEDSTFNGNISNWDVSNVTTMSYMFEYSEFNQDISSWFNKLHSNINLLSFGILNNNVINSYEDFKKYRRNMILSKL